MYSSLYGAGAVQPIYTKKGRVKNQAEIDAANAARAASGGGLLRSGRATEPAAGAEPVADAGAEAGCELPLLARRPCRATTRCNQVGGNLANFQNPYQGGDAAGTGHSLRPRSPQWSAETPRRWVQRRVPCRTSSRAGRLTGSPSRRPSATRSSRPPWRWWCWRHRHQLAGRGEQGAVRSGG